MASLKCTHCSRMVGRNEATWLHFADSCVGSPVCAECAKEVHRHNWRAAAVGTLFVFAALVARSQMWMLLYSIATCVVMAATGHGKAVHFCLMAGGLFLSDDPVGRVAAVGVPALCYMGRFP